MRLLSIALLCVTAGFAFAQATPQAQSSTQKTGAVEGVVVNEITKEPIRRVDVRLAKMSGEATSFSGADAESVSATTDAEGKFRFENLQPGSYRLTFQRQGFLGGRGGAGYPMPGTAAITVSEGLELKSLRYALVPQAVITGRVLDEEGEPVQGVFVSLLMKRYVRGQRQWTIGSGQPTNDRGEFRLVNISPGNYLLGSQPGMGPIVMQSASGAPGQLQMGYVPTYYPGVTNIAEATPITVKAGMEMSNIDISLRRQQVYSIRGRVLDEDGKPLQTTNYFVSLMQENRGMGLSSGRMSRPKEGEFQISNVMRGSYNLLLQTHDGGPESIRLGITPVAVSSSDLEGISVQLQRGATISGTVVIEGPGDKPAVGGLQVGLNPSNSNPFFFPFSPSASKEDGSFTINKVASGRYTLYAMGRATASTYRAGVQVGGVLSKSGAIEVGTSDLPNIKIILRTDGSSLQGTIDGFQQGIDTQSLMAILRSTNEEILDAGGYGSEVNTAVSQNGTFTFRNQMPGEYKLWVLRDYEWGALSDPEVFKKLESQSVTVKLAAGQSSSASAKITDFPKE